MQYTKYEYINIIWYLHVYLIQCTHIIILYSAHALACTSPLVQNIIIICCAIIQHKHKLIRTSFAFNTIFSVMVNSLEWTNNIWTSSDGEKCISERLTFQLNPSGIQFNHITSNWSMESQSIDIVYCAEF